jgi:hypothetical protein
MKETLAQIIKVLLNYWPAFLEKSELKPYGPGDLPDGIFYNIINLLS